jgi:PKD repeat protein
MYASAGTYTVNLTVTNASGSNSRLCTNSITVTVAPVAPIADFTVNVTSGTAPCVVKFTDTSTGTPTAWNWSFTNVTGNTTQVWFSTVHNPSPTFGIGNYSLVLNASNSEGYNLSTHGTFINVTAANLPDEAGVFLNGGGWWLDANGNGTWDTGDEYHMFGSPGVQAVTGVWNLVP